MIMSLRSDKVGGMEMIAFLTSSPTGPLDGARKVEGLDKWNSFVDNLKKYWKPSARNLMITAAPDEYERNDEMIEFFSRASTISGLSWSAFDLWDGRDGYVSQEMLHSYDVIWLGGGHGPTQNTFFQEIELKEKLQGFEGIIIGISAGSMNSADVCYALPEEDGEAVDPEYKRFIRGLDLTKTQILPHYQMVKDWYKDGMRLYDDIVYGDSYGNCFLVLPDGSYLLIKDGVETVWGEAWKVADGKIYKICEQNETIIWEK